MPSLQENPTWSKDGARLLILVTIVNEQKYLGAAVQVTHILPWAILDSLRLLGTSRLVLRRHAALMLHLLLPVSLHDIITGMCSETWPNVAVEEESRFHVFGRSCGEQQSVLTSHMLQRREPI